MKKSEIRVGGHYRAKVSGKLVTVRVDSYGEGRDHMTNRHVVAYYVTNLSTDRKTTFRSAARFREEVKPGTSAYNDLAVTVMSRMTEAEHTEELRVERYGD